jgi:hypothetical protein
MAARACFKYIYSLMRLDHVFHLETSVMGASLAEDVTSGIFAICFSYFVLLRPCARGLLKHNKKKNDDFFLFILVQQFINKPVFLLSFFHF